MIRASSTTAKALAVAIAGAEIVSPLGFGAAAQEVKTAAATRPECVNPKGAWISTCAIAEVDRQIAEDKARADQVSIVQGCATFLQENMGKTFSKDELMARLGNPKTKQEFRAAMDKQACEIARTYKYTGKTASLDTLHQ